ncbi:MAG: hypothetical protein V4662_23230 [Verrucomicrobiota bacterium]
MRHKLTLIILLIAAVTTAAWFFWPTKETDTLNVPLGVEQAAIITFSGPEISVAPYKWGVAVNVRIAQVTEQPGRRIYDVRYIVNRDGTFDLKDYFVAVDGSSLASLPSFKFRGDAKLSKNLDTRIQETEAMRIDVGGRYYEMAALFIVLWLAWLLLIIFYKRPRAAAETDAGPAEPTFAELLRGFLADLEAGTMTVTDKARMEMLLLRRWRDELALGDVPMSVALGAIQESSKTGDALRKLQHWLHHPASPVGKGEVAGALAPFIVEAKAS